MNLIVAEVTAKVTSPDGNAPLLSSSKDPPLRLTPPFKDVHLLPPNGGRGMKRAANGKPKAQPKAQVPGYTDVEPRKRDDGEIIWPAPVEVLDRARAFLKQCAKANKKVLIVPDKDADGLSSGVIVHRTLTTLGLDKNLLDVHLHKRGSSIHAEDERQAMSDKDPSFVIVLDQGSIKAPPIIDNPETQTLLLDHHLSDVFPDRAQVVSACHYPPVATSSLLTYEICKTLHPSLSESLAYLCCVGTHGDLGNTLKWSPPFPDMSATFKQYTKKSINDAVSLVNAPRRTAKYDVITAWNALLQSTQPSDLLTSGRLQAARAEINAEVEAHTHTPPKFTPDGKIAVLKINTKAQVHPVIATRWAGYLSSKKLEIVMVANYGYLEGMVNFSCRIARTARSQDPPVNIIESLKAAADLSTDGLRERMGESFARGHKEASGGVVPVEAFEELYKVMKVGEKVEKTESEEEREKKTKKTKTIEKSPQKNTLGNYFAKKT
ncbi:hypothetical protein LTS08_007836 [Lithohypha guttulata]|nr:hypothetical protein LTS08_007836 [Lithohypha guttulata]